MITKTGIIREVLTKYRGKILSRPQIVSQSIRLFQKKYRNQHVTTAPWNFSEKNFSMALSAIKEQGELDIFPLMTGEGYRLIKN